MNRSTGAVAHPLGSSGTTGFSTGTKGLPGSSFGVATTVAFSAGLSVGFSTGFSVAFSFAIAALLGGRLEPLEFERTLIGMALLDGH